ncbi:hypothetical protein [Actinoplanes aureus]|uniref:Uncharacterized protein n=1 Tax=Actinoplanes aureus TaxID=2792083 RepID=A0A931FZ90_9ACTN|nr:hypothetical protein [Actinoplanes aureus]MBG0565438.1 hypothetical protein [Actinoplanes aureus]
MTIEDLIRAAQEHQADRSVPADRIRAALPRRAARANRHRRYGMLAAGLTAAAVATAVTVPALALRDDSPAVTAEPAAPPASGPASATPSSQPAPGAALPTQVKLEYRPTWVPSGFAEHIRHFNVGEPGDSLGPTLMRVWKKSVSAGDPWGGTELSLYIRTEATDAAAAIDTSGQKVDINGAQGFYTPPQGDRKSSVNWTLDDHTALTIAALKVDISKNDLLRMARSVRPDPGVSPVPVSPRWLPPGWETTGAEVSGPSQDTWRSYVYAVRRAPEPSTDADRKAAKEGNSQSGELSVTVGTTTDAPSGGDRFTVGGHPARHPVRTDEPGKRLIYLVVDLGEGRLMTLIGSGAGLTLDDLKKVAEKTEITPAGLAWLGG